MNDLKKPPQNLEAEQAVIGAILIDNSVIPKIMDLLRPEFFYDPRNEILFETISKLFSENKPVDVLTISTMLKKSKKFKLAGGALYLSEIVSNTPTSANVVQYASFVKESAIRRNLIRFASKLDESARVENRNIEDIMDELETNILSLSQDSSKSDFFDSKTLIELQMEKADEYARNPNGIRGIPTGLKSVDDLLGGFHKSDLIIIAARPSVGKSAFACDVVRHAAVYEKKTIAVFSLEMPAIQIMERMLSQESGINLWDIRMSNIKDYRRFSGAVDKLAESNVFVDETSGINIMQLRSKARKLMIEKGLDMIMIDYLQLMQGNGRYSDNRATEVGEISRSLKILARELNIPVMVLSQLNRAVENRSERIPQLSDLRESGSIEQDADLVIFLSREQSAEEDVTVRADSKIKVDLTVAKHRNGPTGRIMLEFLGKQQKFFDLA